MGLTLDVKVNVAYAALAATVLIVLIVYVANTMRARWEERQRPPWRTPYPLAPSAPPEDTAVIAPAAAWPPESAGREEP